MLHRRRYLSAALLYVTEAIVSGCCPPIDILPPALPNGAEGRSYRQTLSAGGMEPLTWSIVSGSLPAGLRLEVDSGIISGTPTQAGSFAFTVAVVDGSWSSCPGQMSYTLTVIEALTADTTLPPARVGQAYSHSFTASGGVAPYQYELVGLPGGLSFDDQTGTISGTPNVARPGIQLQLTVTDSGDPQQTAVESLILVVKPLPVQITTTTLAGGRVNVPYSEQLAAGNGLAPYTWAVVAGLLPQGLRLNQGTGVISGSPTLVQTQTFTVTATDSDSPPTSDSKELTIVIED